MTEAMSRHEIEDVLSSIRRLVAHDDRPDRKAPPASDSGKLILTSALRVDVAGEERDDFTDDNTDDDTASPSSPNAIDDNAPHAPVRSDRAPGGRLTARSDHPTRSGTPDPAPLLTRIAQAGHFSRAQVAGPVDAQAASQVQQAVQRPKGEPTDNAADSTLDSTLARLEQALSIEQTDVSEPSARTQATRSETPDEALLDEGALEQMVAQIVRQELQGELGERITRSIRKLVRAEVARELQMRNL